VVGLATDSNSIRPSRMDLRRRRRRPHSANDECARASFGLRHEDVKRIGEDVARLGELQSHPWRDSACLPDRAAAGPAALSVPNGKVAKPNAQDHDFGPVSRTAEADFVGVRPDRRTIDRAPVAVRQLLRLKCH
jgi:hypothetical protein